MTPKQFLQRTRDKIAQGWTQHTFARNMHGESVPPHSPAAVCWCMRGAMRTLPWDPELHPTRMMVYAALESVIDSRAISYWNDEFGRTQAEVLAAIDKAMELVP